MDDPRAAKIAYYTVVEDTEAGWTGGLLVINTLGRPVEFQCTLPVRPTRAQSILFGNSLRPHLVAEIIGPLLVKKCRTPITLLCTDLPDALMLQKDVTYPVVLIDPQPSLPEDHDGLLLGGVPIEHPAHSRQQIASIIQRFDGLSDGGEPLERICDAIREAHSHLNHKTVAPAATDPQTPRTAA